MKKIRIVITDDKEKYRSLISAVLKPFPVSIAGEAGNGKELLRLLKHVQPDIILLDLDMPVMDGNEAFEIIRKDYPEIKVVILSFYFEALLIEDYIQRGARGYISKDAVEPELLMKALNTVNEGMIYRYEPSPPKIAYTGRQKEILPLIFEGKTNDEIAEEIHITKRAVEKQRHNIYKRSGSRKAVDFYKYAFSRGLQFLGRMRAQKG
ncbi:MAG: response regulator transcription factor [Bacteroidia bacterium]